MILFIIAYYYKLDQWKDRSRSVFHGEESTEIDVSMDRDRRTLRFPTVQISGIE